MALASTGELYAHALAVEREAAERYVEFAQYLEDQGNYAVAALFRMLARLEAQHLDRLERRSAGLELPKLESPYGWLSEGAPETAARELVFRLMTQRDALAIALAAEKRAQAFFERAARTTKDAAVRALAKDMASEEADHVALIERMLERTPAAEVDWAAAFGEA